MNNLLRCGALKMPLSIFLIGMMIFLPMSTFAGEVSPESPSPSPQDTNTRAKFIPGDAVHIAVYNGVELDSTNVLNRVFPIDDRGFIDLPMYGKAKISHMSESEFKNFLLENFRDYFPRPTFQVRPLIRASVLGGVQRPGLYYIDPDRSLWELIHLTGGTLVEDGLMEMRWDRDRGVIQEDLVPLLQSGVSLKRMGFQSGDQIWVKSPDRPGVIERITRVLPLIVTPITLWLAIDRLSSDN